MRNGVVLIESSSDVLNTDFKNFEGGVPPDFYDELDPLLDINQEAIHLVSSNCNILRDSIINVHRGIVSLNSSSSISDNFLNISIPFITSFTRGMDIDQPARLIIDRNLVQNGFKGISVRDVHIPIRITHNTLNRILSSPRNAAIDIQFLRHLDLPRGLVEDNTINIDHAIASVGINLNNVTAIIVSANPITYTSSFGAGFGNGGIVVTESAGNYLDRNVITGNGSYFSLAANSGITINTSVQNELFCNELTEMHYGMQIAGFNDISPLKTNYFDDANVGLLLRSPCMIGKQDQYGNRWIGEFGNNNTYGAFIHGPDPEGTADLSLFIADESDEDACILIPCAIGPPAIDMGNWFVDENGTGLICETQGGNPQPVADSMIVRLQNPFAFSEYNDEMNWQVKASYFELLLQYPDLLAEDFLDSFYTAEAAQSLGKLMTYRHLLLKDHSLDPEGKSDILEIVDRVSTDIILIDSILYLRPADSLDWMELRELKTDTLTDAHLEWLEVESDDITLSFAVFEEVLDSLDNLIPSDETASNVRQALIFSAFHKTGIPFDPTDSSDLYLLATQCPWLGHMSLGFGQRYYAEITDSTMSSIIYECQEPEPYQEWSPAIQFDQNIHLEVYPNPSTNELSIETESDVEWIFITNVNGQVLGEWQSPGPRLSLYIG